MKPNPTPMLSPEPETMHFARECLLRRGRHLVTPDNMDLQVSYLADRLEGVLSAYFWHQHAPLQAVNPTYVTVNESSITGLFNVLVMKIHSSDEYRIDRISPRMRKTDAEALARSWAAAGGWEIR